MKNKKPSHQRCPNQVTLHSTITLPGNQKSKLTLKKIKINTPDCIQPAVREALKQEAFICKGDII